MKKCPKIRTVFAIYLSGHRGTQTTPPCFLTIRDKILGIHMYQGKEGEEIFVKSFDVVERLERPTKGVSPKRKEKV